MNTSAKINASKLLGYRLVAACEERNGTVGSSTAATSAKLGAKPGAKVGTKFGLKAGLKTGH